MDQQDGDVVQEAPRPEKHASGLTLNQMLKALDKDIATNVAKRIKKLSKKKAVKAPLDKGKADQIKRQVAYKETTEHLTKWEPIVARNRQAAQIQFPLDQQPDILPSLSESVRTLRPINEFESKLQDILQSSDSTLRKKEKISTAEEQYLKAVSPQEAAERHKELQKMRVKLGTYAAKMRRQKTIKSKSYRRLLKQEKIKGHIRKVESNKDALLGEIERLKFIRAKERASLKHKNTGKWAKHAKFRAKYDDEARRLMIEQIGLSEKLTEKPGDADPSESEDEDMMESESESEVSDGDHDDTEVNSMHSDDDKVVVEIQSPRDPEAKSDKPMISEDILEHQVSDSDDQDETQRMLMREAFADDDVVAEFRKEKERIADEEQPKDIDTFLPGWGSWTGPGMKTSKKKRQKFVIKAKKVDRKDTNLGNVIISEEADRKIEDRMLSKLPRGIKDEAHMARILARPVSSSFTSQEHHRKAVMPRIVTKMGARIEPLNKKVLTAGSRLKWI